MAADALDLPGVQLKTMEASIDQAADGKGLTLKLAATRADIPSMGWRRIGLAVEGGLDRDEQGRWLFEGVLRLRGTPGNALTGARVRILADDAANTLQIDLVQDRTTASVALPIDQPTHAQITLKNLPAGWLQGLLSTVWSGRATSGKVDAELALDILDRGIQTTGQFSLSDVGFDTKAGNLAGSKVSGAGRLGIDTSDAAGASIDLDASLRGGELLLGPLYARLPAHPVQLSLGARSQKGTLAIRRLRVGDPDALAVEGELTFDPDGTLSHLDLSRLDARFPAAYDRYGKGWLSALGMPGLQTSGAMTGHVSMEASGLTSFAFNTDSLDLQDAAGRLGVRGLRGGLDWSAKESRPATKLGWRSLQVLNIPNGAAEASWRSDAGKLTLQKPMSVPVLDGQLRIQSLAFDPGASRGERLQTSLVLTQVNMAALSKAFGWPEFGGTIGGAVPSLRYVDDRLELAGGLSLNIFDGFVDVTALTLQKPFSDVPVLTANIALNKLDLALVTGVFDFGNITGRMGGSVADLRLVSWTPVAFKAQLTALEGGRISQQAVNNLTSVGGGGMAAGLQGAVLKIFKTFGYKRIGLSCTLRADVCAMGGLGDARDGYTIVEGSGLPRLSVIGHQHDVDWPTLVRRLKAATEGSAPVVQ
ncbi:hypothetical protein [Luteibacter rhizovicinus]|uniref:hypothetical protein n=1 Tax=Luteibacter rhizovicinus TaxID=242606 RepID=UPI001FB3320C|nr:hypothetical protein [Luteibacter rhizovicinus]